MKCNKQLKYSNYVALSHFHRVSVNNSGLNNLFQYYKRKFIEPGIPFLLFSLYYYYINNVNLVTEEISNIWKRLLISFKAITDAPQHYHLWYIYSYIGLILLLPFLKKMLKSMSWRQCRSLCFICLIGNCTINFSIFLINEFFLGSWVLYYILGYFVLLEESRKYYKHFIIMGLLSFILSIIIDIFYPTSIFHNHLFDTSIIMVLQELGVFVFFNIFNKKPINIITKILSQMSIFTLFMFLWHPVFISLVRKQLNGQITNHYILFVIVVILVTVLSIGASIPCVYIMKKIKNLLQKY